MRHPAAAAGVAIRWGTLFAALLSSTALGQSVGTGNRSLKVLAVSEAEHQQHLQRLVGTLRARCAVWRFVRVCNWLLCSPIPSPIGQSTYGDGLTMVSCCHTARRRAYEAKFDQPLTSHASTMQVAGGQSAPSRSWVPRR